MRRDMKIIAALCVLLGCSSVSAASAAVDGVDLTLRGQTSLPSLGQDGTTKARGQNGDVSVLGDTAFVSGGSKNHGALSTPGRICTDFGGVKVVDISNPAAPNVIGQIDLVPTKDILTGPKGNPRRGTRIKNVASTASSVDVFRNPVINKDILAITTERCEQSFFDGARIEFWDVTDPKNIPSTPIGVLDPENIINPNCNPGPPIICPPGVAPADGRWGIFEDIRMFSRNNGPRGSTKVYAVATSPFSIGNNNSGVGGVSFVGDFRLLDVTDPANPKQLNSFPTSPIGQSSNNGCRTFQAARSAVPTPDGSRAIVSYYDGAQPQGALATSAVETLRADFGIPNSAALFNLDLDNIPLLAGGNGTNESPKTFSPSPPAFGYPAAANGGETPAGEVEGNAADVQTFVGPDGHILAIVSEEDIDPAVTRVTVDGPGVAAYSGRGCETIAAPSKLYQRPAQQLSGEIAYVGRGCPASPLENTTLLAPDPYIEDPRGKIALFESGGDGFNGCSFSRKLQRAAAAGAVGAMYSIGGDFLSLSNAGPDGGLPDIPSVGVQLTAFNKMVGDYVPNRVITGTSFAAAPGSAAPTSWEVAPGSAATNVTVKPLAAALGCTTPIGGSPITPENCIAATNETPIKIRTATPHGLATGDRVAIAGVRGNTAANGTFTVTVPASTTIPESPVTTVFTLNGTAGSGAYTGGGAVVQCPPNTPNCAAPSASRTDLSRFRSVANAIDRVAAVQVKPTNRFTVAGGMEYRTSAVLEVAERTGGTYNMLVDWFDAAGALISTSTIHSLSAVTPRAALKGLAIAPLNAARAGIRFAWSGAGAEGTAYADAAAMVPETLRATLKDNQGVWGEQKIVDFSVNPPKVIGTYQSPTSKVWPPPNNGVFMPREARMFGNELAFTSWMTDGLRVVDVSTPSAPKEVASFVPPGVADPSPFAGAGPNNAGGGGSLQRGSSWPTQTLVTGVDVRRLSPDRARIVISDINGGLSVVDAAIRRPAAAPAPGPGPAPVPIPLVKPVFKDTVKPRLSSLSLTPAVFRARVSGSSITKVGGSRVRYRVSERATTTFTVQRVEQGRRKGASCQRPSRANRKGRACTRYIRLPGSFRHIGLPARLNVLRFSGRLGGRKLPVARYRLRAQPRDAAGNRGLVRTAVFRIKR